MSPPSWFLHLLFPPSGLLGTPGLDTLSDPFSWSWLPGLGRDQDAWIPGELATKPSADLTSSVLEKTTKSPGKAPKSTKKWVTKNTKRPTTPPPGMPTTRRSRVPGTPSTLNLTPRTSDLPKRLTTEAPHRQMSHTPVKLTPRVPWEWTSETVTSLSTQGPQEVTSEATITQIPQASLEPSGESPEGSLESSRDPAPSPSAGVPTPSGEQRRVKGIGNSNEAIPLPPNPRASHAPQVPSGFVWLMGLTGVLAG